MPSVTSAIRDTVSITQFNRGLAGKIFDEVRESGAKVVMKNNAAACVLLSPEEYLRMMDEINDARLLTAAAERLASLDASALIPEKQFWDKYGITQEEVDAAGTVEFE